MSWFYQNQIKSEKEFQEKKGKLRAEAKSRWTMYRNSGTVCFTVSYAICAALLAAKIQSYR
jgi:hypothetical protein